MTSQDIRDRNRRMIADYFRLTGDNPSFKDKAAAVTLLVEQHGLHRTSVNKILRKARGPQHIRRPSRGAKRPATVTRTAARPTLTALRANAITEYERRLRDELTLVERMKEVLNG